ncbi:hypothetical protein QW131_12595 [Roseibium salinum]|nr:hypothetical protein [Roseibium salinum]
MKGRGQWIRQAPALAAMVLVAATALSACTRPTGDFGRAKPSVIHDDLMPAVGNEAARLRGDPVSKFNYTNDEKAAAQSRLDADPAALDQGLDRRNHGGTVAHACPAGNRRPCAARSLFPLSAL